MPNENFSPYPLPSAPIDAGALGFSPDIVDSEFDPLGGIRVAPKSAVFVTVKGKAFEALVEDCIENWQKLFPWEPRLFKIQMEHNKKNDADVWTDEGFMRKHADIPTLLYRLIAYQLDRQGTHGDWMLDIEARNSFFRRFRTCLYGRNPNARSNPDP